MVEPPVFIAKYDFKCKKCEAELTSDSLIVAVVIYGVILLVGEKDGFVGWSCPACKGLATNFTRLDKKSFNQVVSVFWEAFDSSMLGKICYHSFPYQNILKERDYSGYASTLLNGNFEAYSLDRIVPCEPNFVQPAPYCSYLFGSEAVSPAIAVWWYEMAQVEKLIERENQTGLKLFPRYILHNPLYAAIDAFCWSNRLHFEYLKKADIHFDVKEIFLCTEKKRINKAVDFLHLLDTVSAADLKSMSESGFQAFIGPSLITYEHEAPFEEPSSGGISILKHEKLSERVWASFHADWMQGLLENLAEDFISDYLGLIGKIDCTLQSIWNLKQSYLKTLFDAVSSRYKREKIREKANANLQKRVAEAEKAFPDVKIFSDDPAIHRIKIDIAGLAPIEQADSFLLLGERGTGKELFAKAIHQASKRKGRLITVNCGAIPEHLFESEIFGHLKGTFTDAKENRLGAIGEAAGGTVFFDEIGNLPFVLQPKLLRVIQEHEYIPLGSSIARKADAKFIFATNKDLERMVDEGRFMADLYDRLMIFPFKIPPLRDRKGDLPLLVSYFFKDYDLPKTTDADLKPISMTQTCMDAMRKYSWPGNVRELNHFIKNIILRRQVENDRSDITDSDLPNKMLYSSKSTHGAVLNKKLPGNTKVTDEEIIRLMQELDGNKTHVAKELGVDRKTIWLRWSKISESQPPAN
jgi:DNA-binding NtrC family response regulator